MGLKIAGLKSSNRLCLVSCGMKEGPLPQPLHWISSLLLRKTLPSWKLTSFSSITIYFSLSPESPPLTKKHILAPSTAYGRGTPPFTPHPTLAIIYILLSPGQKFSFYSCLYTISLFSPSSHSSTFWFLKLQRKGSKMLSASSVLIFLSS